MKKSVATRLSVLFAAVLTVALSNQAAVACLLRIHATQGSNDMMCVYESEDADWCYYQCTCTGNCDELYAQFGLEEY
jgi:hypothetical protein